MKKLFSLFAAVLMAVSVMAELTSPWSYAFTSADVKGVTITNNTFTINEATWTMSTAGTTVGTATLPTAITKSTVNKVDYYVLKFGSSGSNYFPTVILTTNAFATKNVTKVSVDIRNNGSKAGTLTIKQGGTQIGTATQSAASSDWCTQTVDCSNANGGNLEIMYSVAQASFIKAISVTFEEQAGDDPSVIVTKTVEIPAKGIEDGSLSVTYNKTNAELAEITLYSDEDCTEEITGDSWLYADTETDGSVSYLAEENTAYTSRTIYGKICTVDEDSKDVCSDVITFTQEAAVIPVTGVELNKKTLALNTYFAEVLVATVIPADAENKNVTWESDNTAVATVSATGRVYAKSAGTANITVKTEDGEFTDVCAVTVSNREVVGATFYESFNQFNGEGGNDDKWSNISSSPAVGTYDNTGWTASEKTYSANKCARMGVGKNDNNAEGFTTPAIGKTGNAKIQFLAESWGTDGSNFFVDIEGDGTFVPSTDLEEENITNEGKTAKVAMAKAGKWTEFNLKASGVTAASQLRFYAPANKRAFLDEVAVWVTPDTPTAVENIEAAKATKVMVNGQMMIIRDSKTYNVMGIQL